MIEKLTETLKQVNKVLSMFVIAALFAIIGITVIPEKKVDKEFLPYLYDFESTVLDACPDHDPLRHPGRITIKFVHFPETSTIVGTCYVFPNTVDIVISQDYWMYLPMHMRYALITHELTHCFLGNEFIAAYPLHTPDPNHYMFWQMNGAISADTVKEQLIQVAKDKCE